MHYKTYSVTSYMYICICTYGIWRGTKSLYLTMGTFSAESCAQNILSYDWKTTFSLGYAHSFSLFYVVQIMLCVLRLSGVSIIELQQWKWLKMHNIHNAYVCMCSLKCNVQISSFWMLSRRCQRINSKLWTKRICTYTERFDA